MVWAIGDWCTCVPGSVGPLAKKGNTKCVCDPHTYAVKHFLHGPGHRQSPIDIRTDEVRLDPRLNIKRLEWNYPKETIDVSNTGYCWKAHVKPEGAVLSGGPLNHDYQLEQFHCHWGQDDTVGAEHLVDGHSYAAEVHFVNWNTKYGSFNEALKYGDGLAVLGVFLRAGKEHAELKKLVQLTKRIRHKGESATFNDHMDPTKLLPERGAYYTYLGSLTTPPCNECVVWIVFRDPMEVSPEQLQAFREMTCLDKGSDSHDGGRILNNYRPPLSKEERVVSLGYL